MINEICSRGAYGNVQNNTRKITVNRDHHRGLLVGKTLALHPSREEGLVAELSISRTELGEETLVLADDGILDASAGFELLRQGPNGRGPVYSDAETWERGRSLRRLNRIKLDHIALVPDPAYEDARVLAVRDAATNSQEPLSGPARPNRDLYHHSEFLAVAAALDSKYGLNR